MCISFFILFVVWTLYNVCILYVKLLFVLSLQHFEKVYLFVVLSSYFCVVFVLLLLDLSVCFVSL
jgi:hypothetical protein